MYIPTVMVPAGGIFQQESHPGNKSLVKWLRVFMSRDIPQEGVVGERDGNDINTVLIYEICKKSLLKISKRLSW